eukprot:553851-Amphidinium_carterae.1
METCAAFANCSMWHALEQVSRTSEQFPAEACTLQSARNAPVVNQMVYSGIKCLWSHDYLSSSSILQFADLLPVSRLCENGWHTSMFGQLRLVGINAC